MEEEERVYPLIKTEEEVNEIVKNKINKDLNIERLNHMIKEEKILEDLLIRYNRVKKSWGKADSIVKISGILIVISGGASLIILTCLGGVGLIAASSMIIAQSVLIGIESLNGFITTMLSMRWTKRKKKEFRERIKLIEEYKNKLFYYTQKVREDGIITIDELQRFDLLLNEFNNKLLELKFKQTKQDYNMIKNMSNPGTYKLSEKETKKINKELQKEMKQELMFKTKQEIKKIFSQSKILLLFEKLF